MRWPAKVQDLIISCCLSCSIDKQWLQAEAQNSFERQAIFLLSLVNVQFRFHKSLLLKNDSLTRDNDFPFRSHCDFTATSWLTTSG